MTLIQLEYFRVLAKVLHFTKAADILMISQPSLSYSISQLEKELNVPLFEREGKKIRLTRYGELFLKYVEESLDLLDEGTAKLKTLVDPAKGTVNLGYIYSLSSSFVPKTIEHFYKENPNNQINFNFVQNLNNILMDDLKSGKIDLAFCVNPAPETTFIPIFEQELFLVVPRNHSWANRKEIDLVELQDKPFVSLNEKSGLRSTVDELFAEMNITPNVVFEAEECNAIIAFVSLNFGVSIIPMVPAIQNSDVSVIKIKKPCTRTVYMAWLEDRFMPPPVKKVRDYIIEKYTVKPISNT